MTGVAPEGSFTVLSYRNVTLLGSNALFLAVAALLALRPPWAAAVYPMFAAVFFWSDFRRDEEIHVIFLFLAAALGLALVSTSADAAARLALILETAAVLLLSFGLDMHRKRLSLESGRTMSEVRELDLEIRDLERDLRFYGDFEAGAANQIRLRRDLTDAAKSLGSTLDAQEVQDRLVRVLQKRFPTSRVRIVPGQPSDPMVSWVAETRASLLVRDIRSDERFSGVPAPGGSWDFRSAALCPLTVMRRPFGYLRLEDPEPGRLQPDDLRAIDLFATLASLSLENIRFLRDVNELATHDALTQLHTHRAFQDRLQEELLRAGRTQSPLSLILCDVDHFKRYNDGYGHQAGDLLLKTVAGLLAQHARPVDFVARYGGEEFALVLPGVVRSQAVEQADRIRLRVAGEAFLFQGRRTSATMSFGVASFPQDAATPSQLVRAADERLYRAKEGGRNQVVG